jgi:hypothetical protein
MFGKNKKTKAQAPSLPKLPEGVQVHVMPEQFKGKTLMTKKMPEPAAAKPVPKPLPKPAPKPVPKKPGSQKKKKSSSGLLIVALLLVLLAIIGGVIAFILLTQEDPEPVIVEVPVEVPVEVEAVESDPVPALDTDSDGLTDVEEALYGTDHRNPDTDADTFLDGNEVFHRYDPLALSPSTLLDTGSVEIFLSPDTIFEVYYPASWEAASAFDMGTGVLSDVQFRTSNTATISIAVVAELPFSTETSTLIKAAGFEEGLTKEGYLSYEDQEELVFYVDAGEALYKFEYDLADESLIHFLQTFKMVVNSFKVLK